MIGRFFNGMEAQRAFMRSGEVSTAKMAKNGHFLNLTVIYRRNFILAQNARIWPNFSMRVA